MKYFTILILCFIGLNISCHAQIKKDNIKDSLGNTVPFSDFNISMIRLIANPEKYDGKLIQVQGFFNLSSEGTALYCHQEDFQHNLTENAVLVDLSRNNLGKDVSKYKKRYVILVGKFEIGRDGLFVGTIKDITRLDF